MRKTLRVSDLPVRTGGTSLRWLRGIGGPDRACGGETAGSDRGDRD